MGLTFVRTFGKTFSLKVCMIKVTTKEKL